MKMKFVVFLVFLFLAGADGRFEAGDCAGGGTKCVDLSACDAFAIYLFNSAVSNTDWISIPSGLIKANAMGPKADPLGHVLQSADSTCEAQVTALDPFSDPNQSIPAEGATTYTRGVWHGISSPVEFLSEITLSGGPDDEFVFKIPSHAVFFPLFKINLSGGAQASNVYFIADHFIFSAGSSLVGTFIATGTANSTLEQDVKIQGRFIGKSTGSLTSIKRGGWIIHTLPLVPVFTLEPACLNYSVFSSSWNTVYYPVAMTGIGQIGVYEASNLTPVNTHNEAAWTTKFPNNPIRYGNDVSNTDFALCTINRRKIEASILAATCTTDGSALNIASPWVATSNLNVACWAENDGIFTVTTPLVLQPGSFPDAVFVFRGLTGITRDILIDGSIDKVFYHAGSNTPNIYAKTAEGTILGSTYFREHSVLHGRCLGGYGSVTFGESPGFGTIHQQRPLPTSSSSSSSSTGVAVSSSTASDSSISSSSSSSTAASVADSSSSSAAAGSSGVEFNSTGLTNSSSSSTGTQEAPLSLSQKITDFLTSPVGIVAIAGTGAVTTVGSVALWSFCQAVPYTPLV